MALYISLDIVRTINVNVNGTLLVKDNGALFLNDCIHLGIKSIILKLMLVLSISEV